MAHVCVRCAHAVPAVERHEDKRPWRCRSASSPSSPHSDRARSLRGARANLSRTLELRPEGGGVRSDRGALLRPVAPHRLLYRTAPTVCAQASGPRSASDRCSRGASPHCYTEQPDVDVVIWFKRLQAIARAHPPRGSSQHLPGTAVRLRRRLQHTRPISTVRMHMHIVHSASSSYAGGITEISEPIWCVRTRGADRVPPLISNTSRRDFSAVRDLQHVLRERLTPRCPPSMIGVDAYAWSLEVRARPDSLLSSGVEAGVAGGLFHRVLTGF
ncbi:hypothetical protein C2E23DRAFT_602121 [Lenzites betulinus]|nr:hypothetical protein C2E23DRAFT_602121 [Lenzites betulinus]